MPSSKSKKKVKRSKALRKFKSKLEQKGLTRDMKVRVNPPDEEKMSEVLVRFVEPYAQYAETEKDYQSLYSVAALAWNAALLSSKERYTLDELIHKSMPAFEKDTKLIINELIHRKERYFSEYSKMIVHYEVKMMGDHVHVAVASTML
jgi:hypothetical protein